MHVRPQAKHVRFSLNHVGFTPESGHVQCNSVGPLGPIADIVVIRRSGVGVHGRLRDQAKPAAQR
jgi:hypothetical protein